MDDLEVAPLICEAQSFPMTDRLWFLFEIWLATMSAGLIHMLVAWFAAVRAGVDVVEFKVFYGKPIVTLKWQLTSISLGWLPLGMYVKFHEESYPYTSWKQRGVLPLVGPIVVAMGALCFLGVENGGRELIKGFGQWIESTMHPIKVGVPLLERAFAASLLWPVLAGIIWARYAVYQVFPVPGLAGGAWWMEAFRRRGEGVPGFLGMLGFSICIAVWISWTCAFWNFAFANSAK